MSQRKTVTCPNPDVLAQAVAVRVLTTIRNLLADPGRSRVDIALTGGTDGNRVLRAIGTDPLADECGSSISTSGRPGNSDAKCASGPTPNNAMSIAAAFAHPRNPQPPSSFADGEELIWYIDQAAASKL